MTEHDVKNNSPINDKNEAKIDDKEKTVEAPEYVLQTPKLFGQHMNELISDDGDLFMDEYDYFDDNEEDEEYSGTCGEDAGWYLKNGRLVIEGTGKISKVSGINKKEAEIIRCCTKELIIGDGITSIDQFAFYEYVSLESVHFSESLTSIGKYAFSCCKSLESITLPEDMELSSLTSIEEGAFRECVSLKEIILPDKVNNIARSAFYRCTSLVSINIPKSLRVIAEFTFYECKSLSSIKLHDNIISIEDFAFYGCGIVGDVRLPENIECVGECAFNNCTSVLTVTIPHAMVSKLLVSSDEGVFEGCNILATYSYGGVTEVLREIEERSNKNNKK